MTATVQPRSPSVPAARFAGFWIRALAFLIDSVVIGLIVTIVSAGRTGALAWANGPALDAWRALPETLVGLIYLTVLWSWIGGGRTVGMRVLGLRVVGADGGPISLPAAVVRWIGIVLSAAFLLIGLAWVALDARKQGWHDKLAGSFVLRGGDGNDALVQAEAPAPAEGTRPRHPAIRAAAIGIGLLGTGLVGLGFALALDGDPWVHAGPVLVVIGIAAAAGVLGAAGTWTEPVLGAVAFLGAAIALAVAAGPSLGPWYDGLLAATTAGPATETAYWSAAPSMAPIFTGGLALGLAGLLALAGVGQVEGDPA
jgi:uncharacterized RDD family membrane protein YckC